jgi:hypothetical protein
MIKSNQNHSYIFVSPWQYAFLANYQFFQFFVSPFPFLPIAAPQQNARASVGVLAGKQSTP